MQISASLIFLSCYLMISHIFKISNIKVPQFVNGIEALFDYQYFRIGVR